MYDVHENGLYESSKRINMSSSVSPSWFSTDFIPIDYYCLKKFLIHVMMDYDNGRQCDTTTVQKRRPIAG